MRLFLAIPLPEELKERIDKIKFKTIIGRRVGKENYHINLYFFGEMPTADKIIKKLEKIKQKPFEIRMREYGAFPHENYIRIIHLQCESEDLTGLYNNIMRALEKKETIPFKPHITLYRVKKVEDKQLLKQELAKKLDYKFQAESMILYKSELTPQGPVYTVLKQFIF